MTDRETNEQLQKENEQLRQRLSDMQKQLDAHTTAQHHQDETLHLYQLLVENAPDSIGVTTPDGTIVYMNPANYAMLGGNDTLIGTSIYDLLLNPPHELQRHIQHVTTHGHWQGGLTFKHSDGSTVRTQASLLRIDDSEGTPRYIAGILRDITQQLQMDEERALMQLQIIEAQQTAIQELGTPLLPIADGIIVLPLVGSIDHTRSQRMTETLLEGIAQQQARIAIIDMTGVKMIDTQVAQSLVQTAQAVQLLGAQVVLTGIAPDMAQTLVHLGTNLDMFVTRSTLQAGIAYAIRQSY